MAAGTGRHGHAGMDGEDEGRVNASPGGSLDTVEALDFQSGGAGVEPALMVAVTIARALSPGGSGVSPMGKLWA